MSHRPIAAAGMLLALLSLPPGLGAEPPSREELEKWFDAPPEKSAADVNNVEYLYAFVQQSGANAIIIFRFDETDRAIEVLSKNQVKILEGKKVYTL